MIEDWDYSKKAVLVGCDHSMWMAIGEPVMEVLDVGVGIVIVTDATAYLYKEAPP